MKRREVLKWLCAGAAGGGALAFFAGTRPDAPGLLSADLKRRGLIRPPGSLSEAEFLSRCIRCQRCSQACDTQAIHLVPGSGSRLGGTPVIIPEEHACDLCLRCGPACPTGAIAVLDDKAHADMGYAVVDEALCVSINGTGICGACFTACPLRGTAITQGMHNAPSVDREACVGCGLCEEACIVHHDKAIRVRSARRWTS
jgi:MauM/NapG family ferredoxin protein